MMGETVEDFGEELKICEKDEFVRGKGEVADGGIEGGDQGAEGGKVVVGRGVGDADAEVGITRSSSGGCVEAGERGGEDRRRRRGGCTEDGVKLCFGEVEVETQGVACVAEEIEGEGE